MSLKQKIHTACMDLLNEKIEYLNAALSDLAFGSENDAKSSAGDKHETARAMMQIEHEKIGNQREEFLRQKNELASIDINRKSDEVTKGSLIKTNHGYLFLAVPVGKINIKSESVIALSPISPLGQKLIGLKKSDTAEMNGVKYKIEAVE
jgi:transcription elongation GreA/GreB family factor